MMHYRRVYTKQFRKDLHRLEKSGFNLHKLEVVISTLATGAVLPDVHRDHPLKGVMKGSRECHIGPDWILRYIKRDDVMVLLLLSTGNHRRVLGIE